MGIHPIQRQSLISLISTVGLTALAFLSTMYFSHSIGPALMGGYFLFLAYYSIFFQIADGGFGKAAVKRISEGQHQNEFYSAFIALRFGLCLCAITGLLYVQKYLIDLSNAGLINWLILAILVSVFWGGTFNGLYGAGKVGITQISVLLNNLLKIVFQVIAVYLGYGVGGLAGGFVFGMVAGGFLNYHYLSLKIKIFKIWHIKNLFSFSFWIFLSGSGAVLFNTADTIFIGYFLTNADVGIYRIALQLTTAATFTTVALQTVLYPKISYMGAQREFGAIENVLARAFTYSLILAVPVCIGGWIFGRELLYYFYGASFAPGTAVFMILLIVQLVNIFMYLLTMSLNALDRPRDSFKGTAIAIVINIILNVVFIPLIGIIGAALATLITMIVNALIVFFFLNRILAVRLETKPVRNIALASLVMGAVLICIVFLLPLLNLQMLLLYIGIGAFIYVIILLKLDVDIKSDMQNIIRKFGLRLPYWL